MVEETAQNERDFAKLVEAIEKTGGGLERQVVDAQQKSTLGEGFQDDSEELQRVCVLAAKTKQMMLTCILKEYSGSQAIDPVGKIPKIHAQPADIRPFDSLDLFDPDLPEAAATALNIPPICQYQQRPGAANSGGYGESSNSIPLPNLPSQSTASPGTQNWPPVGPSTPDPSESTTNINSSDQTTL